MSKMQNPITYIIFRHRQRQERKRMYRELSECLMQVARAMDDFGDVLVEESRSKRRYGTRTAIHIPAEMTEECGRAEIFAEVDEGNEEDIKDGE